MPRSKQRGSIRKTGYSPRTGPTRTVIADSSASSARKSVKPQLTKPFYVAVDRQLKSEHESYEAAEKAAIEIKKRHPKLHVTVFDAKEQRHTPVELPPPANDRHDPHHDRHGNAATPRKATATGRRR
jgi:riboflavin biosynthesis pyrimidine reductase